MLARCSLPAELSIRAHVIRPRPGFATPLNLYSRLKSVMARRRRRRPPGGQTTAAGSGGRRVPPSLQIPPHTHILLARSPAPYSPSRRKLASYQGKQAHPVLKYRVPHGSHIVLYSRALCARLCVLAPPSPARAPCSHPQPGPPGSATSPVIVLY